MSRTLTLIDTGWESVQAFAARSHRREAVARVEKLLSRPDLPAPVEADARRLAAELLSDAEKYPEARRHLSAAADLQPGHAHTQYLLGVAQENDPHGEDRKAAARFRKAAELAPANALYRAAHGRALVRSDRPNAGVRVLLAVDDNDVAVVGVVADGLLALTDQEIEAAVEDGALLEMITFPDPPTTTGNGGPTTNTPIAFAGLLLKRKG